MGALDGAGTYNIVYQYSYLSSNCVFYSDTLKIEVEDLPLITLSGIDEEYCIKNTTPVPLLVNLTFAGDTINNPPLIPDSIYMQVRKISGGSSEYEILKDVDENLTYIFDPNRLYPVKKPLTLRIHLPANGMKMQVLMHCLLCIPISMAKRFLMK